MRRALLAPVLGATAVLLSGCAAAAAPSLTPSAAASPMPSVPLLAGRVVARTESTGDGHVWVRSADPGAGYAAARQLLVDGGFTLTKDRPGAGGGDGEVCTAALCVNFTGRDDPAYGPTVEYEVYLPATSGAP